MNLLFSSDEELGKKNDDHRPNGFTVSPNMFRWRRVRRGRLAVGVVSVIVLYIFFKNIPTDVPPVGQRKDLRFERPVIDLYGSGKKAPSGPPPGHSRATDERSKQTYEGSIKFQKLADTLDAIHPVRHNSNVLFLTSNLKSVSSLIPLACQMASAQRNHVHFALVGRNDLGIEKIRELNGVDDDHCQVTWHDGRPDYALYSTDWRMEVSIKAAITYIYTDVLPQIMIVDDFERDDDFFKRSFKAQTEKYHLPFLELPKMAPESIQWLARLDTTSLKQWKSVQVDILIQAPRESSGSLIRLLKSIEDADYTGSSLPKIIIDLPENIDKPTLNFVEAFRWPLKSHGVDVDDKLILHHRINGERLGHDQAAQQTLELVYPKNPHMSHVLMLSPQAELSASYFQYLKYVVLEYRHSSSIASRIMGISLDLPTKRLDGITNLDLPTLSISGKAPRFFVSQQPNSNAALYVGAFWRELHSLIANRLSTTPAKTKVHEKLVSDRYPSWMEYCTELLRARGHFFLYPGFATKPESAMAVIHNELYQIPEGTVPEIKDEAQLPEPRPIPDSDNPDEYPVTDSDAKDGTTEPKALTASVPSSLSPSFNSPEPDLVSTTPLLDLIGLSADRDLLPRFSTLPALDAFGKPIDMERIDELTTGYLLDYMFDQGGCRDMKDRKPARFWAADDLFCDQGQP